MASLNVARHFLCVYFWLHCLCKSGETLGFGVTVGNDSRVSRVIVIVRVTVVVAAAYRPLVFNMPVVSCFELLFVSRNQFLSFLILNCIY